jgi:hypothetical protein
VAPRRIGLTQAILGGMLAFFVARALLLLARAFLGAPRGGAAPEAKATVGKRRSPRIDRSSAIDVPFTVLGDGATEPTGPAESREPAAPARGSG